MDHLYADQERQRYQPGYSDFSKTCCKMDEKHEAGTAINLTVIEF